MPRTSFPEEAQPQGERWAVGRKCPVKNYLWVPKPPGDSCDFTQGLCLVLITLSVFDDTCGDSSDFHLKKLTMFLATKAKMAM